MTCPFNTLLSADLLYVGTGAGVPAYSPTNNGHYQARDDQNADLKLRLSATTQTMASGLPDPATAGVMTTRAAAEAFFVAGTNRAMFRFTMLNHLCHDMDQVLDTSRAPDRIRQDVSRSPGGDSRIFLNNCIGCHSGMDPLAQAFAYYTFDPAQGRMQYTPGVVRRSTSTTTHVQVRVSYAGRPVEQLLARGPERLLGWDSQLAGSGTGASPWATNWPTAMPLRTARSRKPSATSACGSQWTAPTARRSTP